MGIRVLKTAVAAIAAIYAAQFFSLNFVFSAGLLAVLGVDVTRKRSLISAVQRIGASILGLLFGSLIFYLFGFYLWSIAIFILVVYPLLSKLRMKDGIVTGSVILFHVYQLPELSFPIMLNEIALLAVGFGSATLFNIIYMPGSENKLRDIRKRVEESFSTIFSQMATQLRDIDYLWLGSEIIEANAGVTEGCRLAAATLENALFRTEDHWTPYFQMRRTQLDSIQRMLALMSRVYENLPHCSMVADLFDDLSRDVKEEHYMGNVEKKLLHLEEQFKRMELPASRSEFEVRSSIFQLILELKGYLKISKEVKQSV